MSDESRTETAEATEDGARRADDLSDETAARYVAFALGEQAYALPIERVREVQRLVALADGPSTRGAVVGMLNLRGHVIPAYDVRHLLSLPVVPYTLDTTMMVVEARTGLVAFIVDEVDDVVLLDDDDVEPASELHDFSEGVIGVATVEGSMLYVIDTDRMLERSDLDAVARD
jgi:purine-binding chemotaxis protein CheW